jgi:pilus assembly protein CpaC
MRRSTTKAAAAIVALSVALPATAQDGGYFIGPDGSVEYTGAPSAPSAEPLSTMISATPTYATPTYATMAPVEDAPVEMMAPSVMGVETMAADIVSEPVTSYTMAPAAPEVTSTIVYDAAPTFAAEPAVADTYDYSVDPSPVEVIADAPVMVSPTVVETMVSDPIVYTDAAAPAPAVIEYVDAPVIQSSIVQSPVVQTFEPNYTTLADPTPLSDISALPMAAPSGFEYASRGDGGYGQSTIDRGGESAAGQSTEVFVSKSAVVNLPADATEVSISDPSAVRGVLRTSRQIVLIGLKVGSTNVIVFDDNNRQILNLDVTIRYDLRPLRAALKRNFPNTLIEIESLLGEVILTGAASGPGEAQAIRNLVRRYLYSAMLGAGAQVDPESIEFVDRLATESDDQILVKVRVAEMRRSVVRQFGVDWSVANDVAAGAFTGQVPGLNYASSGTGGLLANLSGSIDKTDFGSLVDAFERHNVIRTLAEPTLTAVSGETASFLAGGQFPIPTSVEDGEIGYEFRDFGVALEFTPVVVGEGRISLQVATEISELTDDNSIQLNNGLRIPGLSVRRANTTVELPSGGTMSIAGMLQQSHSSTQSGVPGVKNVPVLGQLFSSSEYNSEETELVILVTPYVVKPGQEADFRLPTDGFAPASDIDFYLLGRLHKVYGTGSQDVAAARQALNAPLGFIIE